MGELRVSCRRWYRVLLTSLWGEGGSSRCVGVWTEGCGVERKVFQLECEATPVPKGGVLSTLFSPNPPSRFCPWV